MEDQSKKVHLASSDRTARAGFTPGPWLTKRNPSYVEIPIDRFSSVECYAGTPANAHLIAAAPTMAAYISKRAAQGDEEAARIMEEVHGNA